ncbi:hypothetical protein F4782DRAFT_423598 [Xylaria castorea]|nr:hypothetical protein F4782DRAFT_423598 [Xylaria castorea]
MYLGSSASSSSPRPQGLETYWTYCRSPKQLLYDHHGNFLFSYLSNCILALFYANVNGQPLRHTKRLGSIYTFSLVKYGIISRSLVSRRPPHWSQDSILHTISNFQSASFDNMQAQDDGPVGICPCAPSRPSIGLSGPTSGHEWLHPPRARGGNKKLRHLGKHAISLSVTERRKGDFVRLSMA